MQGNQVWRSWIGNLVEWPLPTVAVVMTEKAEDMGFDAQQRGGRENNPFLLFKNDGFLQNSNSSGRFSNAMSSWTNKG